MAKSREVMSEVAVLSRVLIDITWLMLTERFRPVLFSIVLVADVVGAVRIIVMIAMIAEIKESTRRENIKITLDDIALVPIHRDFLLVVANNR